MTTEVIKITKPETMHKGDMVGNLKFLIRQYEREIEYSKDHPEEYSIELLEEYENVIIELKYVLKLEGIDYDKENN